MEQLQLPNTRKGKIKKQLRRKTPQLPRASKNFKFQQNYRFILKLKYLKGRLFSDPTMSE